MSLRLLINAGRCKVCGLNIERLLKLVKLTELLLQIKFAYSGLSDRRLL
jgi:hypothetical protein